MNPDILAGGFMLLAIVLGFILAVGFLAAAMVGGFSKVEQFDHRRAVERDMRRAVDDANLQQKIARKILDEYQQ
jgi:hypothetical protein